MIARHSIPRIVIAGVSSNVGKTTITTGVIAALTQQGLAVQPFKCGPDYIDPSYHERAAQRPCRNLDAWMLGDTQLLEGFARACQDADIAVIEGVMGLFDGSNWDSDHASTAQIAKLLRAPVLLVVDISGHARSAAAVVLGCQKFDPELPLCGVILNFAGSEGHAKGCGEAITNATGLPVLGWLPRRPELKIPERHLGLVLGGEDFDANERVAEIAVCVKSGVDIAAILTLARGAPDSPQTPITPSAHTGSSRFAPVIAVARDEAFRFYYPENLELLAEAGATIEFFSPLAGEHPGPNVAGVYLGGGYPELYGERLAQNVRLWERLRELRDRDAPIYAECGGFMALMQGLIDCEGRYWPMAGIIPGLARMTNTLAALGYRYATALRANLLAESGEALRGHEFRYSNWVCDQPIANDHVAWQVRSTRARTPADSAGFVSGKLLASYLHVHFGQRSGIANRFVQMLE